MRLLVVDDHEGFRHALVTTLNLVNGLEVVAEAENGERAVEQAGLVTPDAVLMDLSMPGISGIDAMRRIHRQLPNVPVVILTAHADPAIERDAIAAGASAFIAKGAGLQALVDHLVAASTASAGQATRQGSA